MGITMDILVRRINYHYNQYPLKEVSIVDVDHAILFGYCDREACQELIKKFKQAILELEI